MRKNCSLALFSAALPLGLSDVACRRHAHRRLSLMRGRFSAATRLRHLVSSTQSQLPTAPTPQPQKHEYCAFFVCSPTTCPTAAGAYPTTPVTASCPHKRTRPPPERALGSYRALIEIAISWPSIQKAPLRPPLLRSPPLAAAGRPSVDGCRRSEKLNEGRRCSPHLGRGLGVLEQPEAVGLLRLRAALRWGWRRR